jgi:hypothetical protein
LAGAPAARHGQAIDSIGGRIAAYPQSLAIVVQWVEASDGIKKNLLPRKRQMSIEKKSLISNRVAAKKALATKPEVSKVASTRVGHTKVSHTKVAANKIGLTKIGLTKIGLTKIGLTKIGVTKVRTVN